MSSLEQFMVFKEVAEIGNITQASKRLHISQPSVSIQIQNLEHEYGAPLFYRTNRRVTLTDPGNILYEKVIYANNLTLEFIDYSLSDPRDYDKGRILDNAYIPLVMFLNIEPFPCVRVP